MNNTEQYIFTYILCYKTFIVNKQFGNEEKKLDSLVAV